MKKIALITLIGVLFAGCTTEEYYETYVNDYQKNYTIRSNPRQGEYGWKLVSDEEYGVYYCCIIKDKNLTNEVFNYGIMTAYLRYVYPGEGVDLHVLPFDDFYIKDGNQWTEQVSCAFRPGEIVFMLKNDDQIDILPIREAYEFQVRFMW
ncbi:hypothetical protein LJC52_03470 [Bacteroidales bacterium OttesenSCG-928-A17]|nr:hypothetical protein [Bacteroidales bacterium OttesenSCG-928-A17]